MSLTIHYGSDPFIEGDTKFADKVKCSQNGQSYNHNDLKIEEGESCTVMIPNSIPLILEKTFILNGTTQMEKVTNIFACVHNSIIGDTAKIIMERESQLPTFLFIDKSTKVSPKAKIIGFDYVIYFDKNNIDTLLEKYGAPITPSIIYSLKEYV